MEGLIKERSELAGIDAEVVRLEHRYKEAQNNKKLSSALLDRMNIVFDEEKKLAKERKNLETLTKEAVQSEQHHHDLYQAFISGQAGILAEELRQSLARQGEAECPVCRSRFHTGQEHCFAILTDKTPTKTAVDTAKREYEKKEQERGRQEGIAEKLHATINAEKEAILREAQALLDCPDWGSLASDGYLARQMDSFSKTEACVKSSSSPFFFPFKNPNIRSFLLYYYFDYNFIVSAILFLLKSTLITFTSTISPTFTTSSGCLI